MYSKYFKNYVNYTKQYLIISNNYEIINKLNHTIPTYVQLLFYPYNLI